MVYTLDSHLHNFLLMYVHQNQIIEKLANFYFQCLNNGCVKLIDSTNVQMCKN